MTHEELLEQGHAPGRWAQHRFMVLVALTIFIALFLVSVALALYASSGAAQLDLSRPGYVSVRKQVTPSNTFNGYSASGPIDKEALDQFRKLYDKQAHQATGVDSFGGTVMSDQVLSLDPQPEQ